MYLYYNMNYQLININKSIYDDNLYKFVVLKNKLKVLMISNPNTQIASASMVVGVGSLSDGKIYGMAHFLEHMLFMGNKKYPQEDYYFKTIAQAGGSSNAYTADTHTNYYFSVNPNKFLEILDLFGHFFIDPLLNKNAIEREMNAVNAEHEKNINNDDWRIQQMGKIMTGFNSPIHNFNTGSLESLKNDNMNQLMNDFYQQYYSANNMTLVVLGKEPIDILFNSIIDIFETVPNYSNNVNTYTFNKILMKQQSITELIPIKNDHTLVLFWELNNNLQYIKYHINDYILYVIGSENKGSIAYILKKIYLIESLKIAINGPFGSKQLLQIIIKLTDKGSKYINEIIHLICDYIKNVSNQIQSYLYDEIKYIDYQRFMFNCAINSENAVSEVSAHLHLLYNYINIQELLQINSLYNDFNDTTIKIIKNEMNNITFNNMFVIISSKIFNGKTYKKEKWYKIKYNLYDNQHNNYFKINNHIIYNKIKKMIDIPFNNNFIPQSFQLNNNNITITNPIFINTPNNILMYYKQNIINIPETNIVIKIYSEWLNKSSINKIILNFYIKLIKFNNYDFFNSIKIAGYTLVIKILDNKILLIINGINNKIYDVVQNIINIFFRKNNINENIFLFQKEIEINKLQNKIYESPHLFAYNLLKEYINPNFISYNKQIDIINNLTFNDYNYILLHLINNKMYVSCFIIGDETYESLINISNIFTPFILNNNYIINNNTLKIINNNNTIIEINEINQNINDANSAIIYSFHLDYIDFNNINNAVTNLILMNLINSIISSKFFDTLRTKEQLGYIVQSKIKEIGYDEYPYYIHNLIIQSPHKCAEFIKNRIKMFLSNFRQYLNNMSNNDINNYIHSQIAFHSKPFNNIKDDIIYYTDIFLHNHTNFNLRNIIVEKLKLINKTDIINYFDKYYINGIKTIILLNSQNIHNA
jgi:insulysin